MFLREPGNHLNLTRVTLHVLQSPVRLSTELKLDIPRKDMLIDPCGSCGDGNWVRVMSTVRKKEKPVSGFWCPRDGGPGNLTSSPTTILKAEIITPLKWNKTLRSRESEKTALITAITENQILNFLSPQTWALSTYPHRVQKQPLKNVFSLLPVFSKQATDIDLTFLGNLPTRENKMANKNPLVPITVILSIFHSRNGVWPNHEYLMILISHQNCTHFLMDGKDEVLKGPKQAYGNATNTSFCHHERHVMARNAWHIFTR